MVKQKKKEMTNDFCLEIATIVADAASLDVEFVNVIF